MKDCQVSNELKILALEAINNAGSGHSGSVLSAGDALYTLYTKHLLSDGTKSIHRDRFVFSNGHACAILYSVLAGLDYFDINELKSLRKYKSMLAGHPEIEVAGIDANTGPLGQGVANAVGMAIAETIMNKRFGVDNYTYCMVGDGCLQEGVGLESLSLAGLYNLNKFILLYDKNNITLDGSLEMSSKDDFKLKFKSMNFNVVECDGHNIEEIDMAITKAKQNKTKPTVIILNTVIAKDTDLENSNLSHGKVFSEEDILKLRKKLKIKSPKLGLSDAVKKYLNNKKLEIIKKFNAKINKFNENLQKNKENYENYLKFIKNDFDYNVNLNKEKLEVRQANNMVLNDIAKTKENIVVLSADLSSSTKVKVNDGGLYSVNNRLGKNIAVGIREHAMGAIANGIALYGGLNVITSTFLTFSNYMIQPIRMAAIMNLPVMFTFSHASFIDSNDGITHTSVEQLDQLRLLPNTIVTRPADIEECATCYDVWLRNNKPMCMCVSKSKTEFLEKASAEIGKGAYLITNDKADINILASGTEVNIAMVVKKELNKKKIVANVVSVPSLELFEKQSESYKKTILNKTNFVIEMSTAVKFLKYVPESHIFNIKEFCVSGDAENLKQQFGFTVQSITKNILKLLKK